MKKFKILLVVTITFLSSNLLKAQSESDSFFNSDGVVNLQTQTLDALADTIAIINHRADDVVWSRVVYRIVDLRDKQNYQLYFPIRPTENFKNLFTVMLDAICKNKLKVYGKYDRDIKPDYRESLNDSSIIRCFSNLEKDSVSTGETSYLLKFDSFGNLAIDDFAYADYTRNVYKYVIKEIVFFNKHYSKLFTQIEAIAPMYALNAENSIENANAEHNNADVWAYVQNSVRFWVKFTELRPYLAKQYAIPNGNETERLTYDDFFTQRMFYSYLLGDQNMFNKMFVGINNNREDIRKEQKRVENELLNSEQDLWEY